MPTAQVPRLAKQYSRVDLSPGFLRVSPIVYEPVEFDMTPFDPLGQHNIPGFVIFCNISKSFDFGFIWEFRATALDLN
jgi:hypothetical protein